MARGAKPKTFQDLMNELHSSSGGAFTFRVQLFDGGGAAMASSAANAAKVTQVDTVGVARENRQDTVSSSAARTATFNTPNQINLNFRGAYIGIKFNSADSSAGLTVAIRGLFSPSSQAFTLGGSSFVPSTGASLKTWLVYPAGSTTKPSGVNGVARVPLPKIWDVQVTHGTTRATDYGIFAQPMI
jgi:hypothetical protein